MNDNKFSGEISYHWSIKMKYNFISLLHITLGTKSVVQVLFWYVDFVYSCRPLWANTSKFNKKHLIIWIINYYKNVKRG